MQLARSDAMNRRIKFQNAITLLFVGTAAGMSGDGACARSFATGEGEAILRVEAAILPSRMHESAG